jgi:adenylyl- and sulfurtransferase ThiI
MHNISLPKMKVLADQVEILLKRSNVEEDFYQRLIKNLEKVEAVVINNKPEFGPDADKIITLCKLLIFNLVLKVTEILEAQKPKLLLQ